MGTISRRSVLHATGLTAAGLGVSAISARSASASETVSKGETFKVLIPAGPLWNNDEAQRLGPFIAAAHLGRFTGQWTTVVPGMMSVVEVELPAEPAGDSEYTMDVLAGPIWNNDDAKVKCPSICASYGGTWNGQWTTVVQGKMSVAGCTFKF